MKILNEIMNLFWNSTEYYENNFLEFQVKTEKRGSLKLRQTF